RNPNHDRPLLSASPNRLMLEGTLWTSLGAWRQSPMMRYELGIIGAGNMAEAIVRGVLRANVLKPPQIIAADVAPARRELFDKELGVKAVESNSEVASRSRALLLSVKPQQVPTALAGIGSVMEPDTLIISIMAGISTAYIKKHLGAGNPWRIIRTMPNTP